tara:strand:- start:20270 stop:20512 length:243 start_codon:yes stop_codon:yes gene_type:complete
VTTLNVVDTFDPDALTASAASKLERVGFAIYCRFLSQGSNRFSHHTTKIDPSVAERRWHAMPALQRTRWMELAEAALEAA